MISVMALTSHCSGIMPPCYEELHWFVVGVSLGFMIGMIVGQLILSKYVNRKT